MKAISSLLVLTLTFYSCYSYKPFTPEEPEEYNDSNHSPKNSNKRANSKKISREELNEIRRGNNGNSNRIAVPEEVGNSNPREIREDVPQAPATIDVTEIIKENQFYKVESLGKLHTIEAKQWKGDTLYSIVKGKPKHELKFHKNDISNVKVRTFSKSKSDALTVTAYVLGGVGLFLLLFK